MTRSTEPFASDRCIRQLNLELRRLEEDPHNAAPFHLRIIHTMHAELMHLSTESLDLKGELDVAKKSVRKLSQQLAEQEDLQARKEGDRKWALAAANMLRTKLKMAQRNIRQRNEHNEQLHKYAVNHTTPAAIVASNETKKT